MLSTRTAKVEQTPDRIIVVRINADVRQSVDDAQENIRAALQAAEGRQLPLFVDLSCAEPLEPEARHFYSGRQLTDFAALGLLVEASPFGRTMANIYLRVARPGIPTRVFSEEEPALTWLRGYAP